MVRTRFALAVALLLALPLAACSSSSNTSKRPLVESMEVLNASTHTVRVSLHVGERVRLEGRPAQPLIDGKPVEIARGQSESLRVRRPRATLLIGHKQDEELVYWLRTEIITPSWDDDAVTWFELLGPPAQQITLKNANARGSTGLVADSASVPIKPLAPDLYPMRDRNYAFDEPSTD